MKHWSHLPNLKLLQDLITSIECDGVIFNLQQDTASTLNTFFWNIAKKLFKLFSTPSKFVADEWLNCICCNLSSNEIPQSFLWNIVQGLKPSKAIDYKLVYVRLLKDSSGVAQCSLSLGKPNLTFLWKHLYFLQYGKLPKLPQSPKLVNNEIKLSPKLWW